MRKIFTGNRFSEALLPVVVLLFLLLYSYARFFLVPYIGFQFNGSTGLISDIFVVQQRQTRLEIGDRLVSDNGHTFSDYQKDLHLNVYENISEGQVLLLLVQGANGIKTIAWEASGFTQAEFISRLVNTWILSYVFWLAGTLTVLLVRPKDERRFALIAFFYISSVWLIAGSISGSRWWYSPFVLRAAIWMSWPIYLHLHWNFPRPLAHVSSRILYILYFVAGVFAALQWVGWLPNSAYLFPFGLAVLGSLLLLSYRFAFRPPERREISLLFFAILFAFGPALIIALLSAERTVSTVAAGYLYSLLVVPGVYFYVVYRRQLGGAELRANRLISLYLFLILLLTLFVALFSVFFTQLETSQEIGATILMVAMVASMLAVFGFPPFQRFVERRLLRIPQPPEHLLPAFAGRISTSFTEEHLVDILQKEVLPSLLIRQSTLVRFGLGVTKPQAIYLQGLEASHLPEATTLKTLATSFSKKPGSVAPLTGGWLQLVIPVSVGGEQLGLWLLGRKDPDDYYSYAERTLLAALADQMAIALVNIAQAKSLRALYQTDIGRQEEERLNLASELHDDVLQQITQLTTEAGDQIQSKDFDHQAQSLNDRVRVLIHGLRPPMLNYGLYYALRELVDDLADKAAGETRLELNLSASEARFDKQVELHTYRIIQQACDNAMQHGNARKILINGQCSVGQIDLMVIDDGRGFTLRDSTDLAELLADHHFGLAGMKERAALIGAQLEIQTAPGKGTHIHLLWRPAKAND